MPEMTGAVEKVAAAIDLDAIEREAVALREWIVRDQKLNHLDIPPRAARLLDEAIPALIAETQRLRELVSWQESNYAEAVRVSEARACRAETSVEAAEARNAAALALCDAATKRIEAGLHVGRYDKKIREALGGETATTQTPAQPACRQCGSPTVPGERSLCSDCWIRQGEDETEMAHAPAETAVGARIGVETDAETLKAQERSQGVEYRDPDAWINEKGEHICNRCNGYVWTGDDGWACSCDSAMFEYAQDDSGEVR